MLDNILYDSIFITTDLMDSTPSNILYDEFMMTLTLEAQSEYAYTF